MRKTRNQGSGVTTREKRKKVVRARLPAPRASSAEQKEERRQAILDMAWHMFQVSSYDDMTMIGIARAMGLVKGTLYRCFKRNEELFLAVSEL
jgi:AcrR family transcriptional regulator